jgi:hypothetical protein
VGYLNNQIPLNLVVNYGYAITTIQTLLLVLPNALDYGGISKLANAVADGTWFPIFRDDQEKYIIQFSKAGALKIWSANNGLQQTVNAVAAESIAYATHTSADELQTLQINDYIFVLK